MFAWLFAPRSRPRRLGACAGWALIGREVHVGRAREGHLPYPTRAIRTAELLYIKNFKPDRWPIDLAPQFSRGLIPTALLLAAALGVYRLVNRGRSTLRSEAVQAVFVFFAAIFVMLTVAGWWFRGKGMVLDWPW